MMKPEKRIYLTGTMRTGASLLISLLSVHSNILIFSERIHFFRFVYKRYDPLDKKNIERLLYHQKARLRYRFDLEMEVDPILTAIERRGYSYDVIYDEMMLYFLERTKKKIWGECSAMNWREIPIFLNYYPNAKAIHIYRDPRGTLASWKKLCRGENRSYLNAIFNWIDSVNHVERFLESMPPDRYYAVAFESIMRAPEAQVKRLCGFLDVPFEAELMQPEKWTDLLNAELVTIPHSAHEGKKIVGYSTKRLENWKQVLESWELCLVDWLAGALMEKRGYPLFKSSYSPREIRTGIDALKSNPILLKNLITFLATGSGVNTYHNDPTDPKNWVVRGKPEEGFIDSPIAEKYFADLNAYENLIEQKYSA